MFRTQFKLLQIYTTIQRNGPILRRKSKTAKNFEEYYDKKDPEGYTKALIGNREIVGYGVNGEPEYVDRVDFPFPSIRYKSPTQDIQALREKERGDWRLLSIPEKKALYRASFCQTFAEFQAPTGEWMAIVGYSLILVSVGLWGWIFYKQCVYDPYPKSFLEARQKAQLKRMIQIRVNPIWGISSYWDYERNKWKKKPWYIPWDDPLADDDQCEEDL